MAANNMREVSQPLDQPDTGTVKLTDPGDDEEGGDEGEGGEGESGGGNEAEGGQQARGADGKPQQRPAKAGGRKERRDIWKENRDLRASVDRQNGQLTQMQQMFQQQLVEMRREVAAGRTPAAGAQPTAGSDSPLAATAKTLSQALAAELQAFQSHNDAVLHNPKLGRYDLTRYNEIKDQLDEAKSHLAIEKYLRDRGVDPNKRAEPQRQVNPNAIAAQVQYAQIRDVISQEYPWVAQQGAEGDRNRKALIRQIEYLTDGKGLPDTLPTHRQAAAMVERDLQLTPARRAAPRQRRDFTDISDDNRASNSGPREISVPSEMLEGTGLSMDKVRRAVFRRNE